MWKKGGKGGGKKRKERGGGGRGEIEGNDSTWEIGVIYTHISVSSEPLEPVNSIPTHAAAASFRMQSTRHSSWEGVKINWLSSSIPCNDRNMIPT